MSNNQPPPHNSGHPGVEGYGYDQPTMPPTQNSYPQSHTGFPGPVQYPNIPYGPEYGEEKKKTSVALIVSLVVVLVVLLVVLAFVIKVVFFNQPEEPVTETQQTNTEESADEDSLDMDDNDIDGKGLTGSANSDTQNRVDYHAPASAVGGNSLQIPGKNVGCELKGGVWGCTMEMTGSEDCGNGKASYVIGRSGVEGRTCDTLYLGEPGDYVPMLNPGDYWQNGSYACKVISDRSIQCWNTDNGDGFLLSPNSYTQKKGERSR